MNITTAMVNGRDNLTAELTQTAYAVAHAHVTRVHGQPPWLELELALWDTVRSTVNQWDRGVRSPATPEWVGDCCEDYLAELADAAYRTVLRLCVGGSFRDLERSLRQTFRVTLESKAWPSRWLEEGHSSDECS